MVELIPSVLCALFLAGAPAPGPAQAQEQEQDQEPQGIKRRLGIDRLEVGGLFSSEEMRMVMTFNLKYAAHRAHPWEERRDVMVEFLREYRPLFMGTQEGLQDQLDYLRENLRGYAYTGISRHGGTEGEHSAVFYDTRRARMVRGDTFWLSQTPDVPGSMSWGLRYPRTATWGEFRVQDYPRSVYMFNTHLSFEEPARTEQARVLLEWMKSIVPVDSEALLTGDFNIPGDTHIWKMFIGAGLRDAWRISAYSDGPDFTIHDWQGPEAEAEDNRIDWILYRPPAAIRQVHVPRLTQVVTWHRDGTWPSDHFPVILANLGLPQVEARDLEVSTQEVRADEPLTVSAQIVNTGERGAVDVQLFVDRQAAETKWIVMDPGEREQLSFTAQLSDPGVLRGERRAPTAADGGGHSGAGRPGDHRFRLRTVRQLRGGKRGDRPGAQLRQLPGHVGARVQRRRAADRVDRGHRAPACIVGSAMSSGASPEAPAVQRQLRGTGRSWKGEPLRDQVAALIGDEPGLLSVEILRFLSAGRRITKGAKEGMGVSIRFTPPEASARCRNCSRTSLSIWMLIRVLPYGGTTAPRFDGPSDDGRKHFSPRARARREAGVVR